jgi:hypothetical protein
MQKFKSTPTSTKGYRALSFPRTSAWGSKMRFMYPLAPVALSTVLLSSVVAAQTIQFTVQDVALKSGESTELADVYFINANCKSVLTQTPAVEILDGPPGVTATINPAKVVPRGYSCAKPVEGGKLMISAKDIHEHSYTRVVLRIRYKTLNGDRERAENLNVALFPSE